jgi:hypothetical protein
VRVRDQQPLAQRQRSCRVHPSTSRLPRPRDVTA